MREALKTNISKYGPKTNAAMTVENVQGKGLQLVVIYAGRKHYLPLSSVPMNADTHANYPNHQKINVDHNGKVSIAGPIIATRPSVTNLANDGEIPITATYANIDPNGADRTGIRFAGAGTAGQILIVENSGAEALTFNNTESIALLRGINGTHDTMPANFVGLFVSDGARWNIIAGGIDTQPDVGLTAP